LIINGETRLFFEPGNVKQLAKSIFNLLNSNDIAKEMGLKGKNFVRKNFDISKLFASSRKSMKKRYRSKSTNYEHQADLLSIMG